MGGMEKRQTKEGSTKAEPASWCRNSNNWSLITFELMNGPTLMSSKSHLIGCCVRAAMVVCVDNAKEEKCVQRWIM